MRREEGSPAAPCCVQWADSVAVGRGAWLHGKHMGGRFATSATAHALPRAMLICPVPRKGMGTCAFKSCRNADVQPGLETISTV